MKISQLLENIDYGIINRAFEIGFDDWPKFEAELVKSFNDFKDSPTINRYQAELLITLDSKLVDDIVYYKSENIALSDYSNKELAKILKRIQPIDKVFYRGIETENQDDNHIMSVQSWSPSIYTAKMFGHYILKTNKPVRGIELSNVYYLHGLLYGGHNGLGDSQAEWFLLNPSYTLLD